MKQGGSPGVEAKVLAAGIDHQPALSRSEKNPQYMLYHDIDIVLDPYPCNGGTKHVMRYLRRKPVVSLGDRFGVALWLSLFQRNLEWVTTLPSNILKLRAPLLDVRPRAAEFAASESCHDDELVLQCTRASV